MPDRLRPWFFLVFLAAVPLPCAAATEEPAVLEQVGAIPLDGVEGRLDHMTVDLEGRRIFVAALGNNTVEVLDASTNERLDTVQGPRRPQGVLFVPEFNALYVANAEGGAVDIYDGRTLKGSDTILFPSEADNLRYDPITRTVYAGYGAGALGVIDASTRKRTADIDLGGHPESFQLEATGSRIFVNVPNSRIFVVDRVQRTVSTQWSTVPLFSLANFPMALNEGHHRLFSVFRSPSRLVVLDTESGRMIAKLPVVQDADDAFYDAKRSRIYVSGGQGAITVIGQTDADHYKVLATLRTAPGARTSLFVPEWGRLYLAVPHRGSQRAEIRVYEARP